MEGKAMKIIVTTNEPRNFGGVLRGDKTVKIKRIKDSDTLISIDAPDAIHYKKATIRFQRHEARAISRGLQSVVEGAAYEETLKITGTAPKE